MEDLLQVSVPTANSIKGHSTLSFDQNIYKVIDFDVGSEQEVYPSRASEASEAWVVKRIVVVCRL